MSIVAAIVLLFALPSPTAIARGIADVIVDTFNCVTVAGSLSHVGKKVHKRLSPAVAHRDSASAVTLVPLVFFVVASLNHPAPNRILRSVTHSMRAVVHRSKSFAPTATRNRLAVEEHCPVNDPLCSAIADTQPSRIVAVSICCPTDDFEPPKALSGEINQWHSNVIIWTTH